MQYTLSTLRAARKENAKRKAAEALQMYDHFYWYGDNDLKDLEVMHGQMLKLRERIAGR